MSIQFTSESCLRSVSQQFIKLCFHALCLTQVNEHTTHIQHHTDCLILRSRSKADVYAWWCLYWKPDSLSHQSRFVRANRTQSPLLFVSMYTVHHKVSKQLECLSLSKCFHQESHFFRFQAIAHNNLHIAGFSRTKEGLLCGEIFAMENNTAILVSSQP